MGQLETTRDRAEQLLGLEAAPAPAVPWSSMEGSANGLNTMQEAPTIEKVLVAGATGVDSEMLGLARRESWVDVSVDNRYLVEKVAPSIRPFAGLFYFVCHLPQNTHYIYRLPNITGTSSPTMGKEGGGSALSTSFGCHLPPLQSGAAVALDMATLELPHFSPVP